MREARIFVRRQAESRDTDVYSKDLHPCVKTVESDLGGQLQFIDRWATPRLEDFCWRDQVRSVLSPGFIDSMHRWLVPGLRNLETKRLSSAICTKDFRRTTHSGNLWLNEKSRKKGRVYCCWQVSTLPVQEFKSSQLHWSCNGTTAPGTLQRVGRP